MNPFFALFLENLERNSGKIAAVIDGGSISYQQLKHDIDSAAAILATRFNAGDRVVFYATPSTTLLSTLLGAFKADLVPAIVHQKFASNMLERMIENSAARGLITDKGADEFPSGVFPEINFVISPDLETIEYQAKNIRKNPYTSQLFKRGGLKKDIGLVVYTSGSTSIPKGVALSFLSMESAVRTVSKYMGICNQDVVLSYSSLGTDYGFYNAMLPLIQGATVVVELSVPTQPESIYDTVRNYRITGMNVFPPVIFRMLEIAEPALQSIPSLRYISSSGQKLPVKHIEMLRDAFPDVILFSNYGMTECKRIAYLPPDNISTHADSVGRFVEGIRGYLLDPEGNEITTCDTVGELALSGDMLLTEYCNLSEINKQRILHNVLGEDRLFLTGDLFRVDADGFLYFVSRKDDVFFRYLFGVNPRVIEKHLLSHPDIYDVAVVPKDDKESGQVPVAFVVPRSGATLTTDALIDFCAQHLTWFLVPVQIEITSNLPKSSSGKTDYKMLACLV